MAESSWREHVLPLPDHDLAWYERGTGPTVLALSGGPGDDHSYLQPVVEPLADRFRWVLYDQRGTGRSILTPEDETTLQAKCLVQDLDALRVALGEERIALVGHSWGANLALLYSAMHPDHVDRAALVGLGPLDDEFGKIAAANQMKPLSRAERQEYARLGEDLRRALAEDDRERMADLHARRLTFWTRAAFLFPEAAAQFIDDYLAAGAHRALNQRVNRLVAASYQKLPNRELLDRVRAALLVLYGYQDFEPITQAYLLRERVPATRLCLLNRCGHLPWLEQPEAFYRVLEEFLAG